MCACTIVYVCVRVQMNKRADTNAENTTTIKPMQRDAAKKFVKL